QQSWRWGKVPESIDELVKAVDRLDGDRCSQIFMGEDFPKEPTGNTYAFPFTPDALEVSGGSNGQYYCHVYRKDCEYVALHPGKGDCEEMVELFRGAPDEVCRECVLSKDDVINIVTSFAKDGSLYCGSVEWTLVEVDDGRV
ncbi:MAG: Imm1 family immunity protein, partial [Pirellulales bacterium]|nr:Imm1 family immunity protein [Pirellulales bacterium]